MTTTCSVCGREVRAARNWCRDQVGQSEEYRISRHRANEQRAPKGTREVICPGSGIIFGQAAVSA